MRLLARSLGFVVFLALIAGGGKAALMWNTSRTDYAAAEAQVAEAIAKGATYVSLENVPALRRLPDNLADMPDLRRLTVSDTLIRDLSPLAGAAQLEYLAVYNTRVSDLTPLAGLSKLTSLNIGKSRVRDLTPLVGLPALERLDMADIEILSLAPTERMARLNWINLHGSYAEDGSKATYERLSGTVAEVYNGSAFRQDYRPHPDWLRQTRWNRMAEDFGLPLPYPREET